MKRAGKCVNKRAYSYQLIALEVAKKMYLQTGTKTAIYECPSCLDFHITSKVCNTHHLHDTWKREGLVVKKKTKQKKQKNGGSSAIRSYERELQEKLNKLKRRVASQYQEFLMLEKKMLVRLGLVEPTKKIKLTGTKKQNTLPLAEQRRILAQLDNKKLSTRKSFWSRLRGIIKVNRIWGSLVVETPIVR